MKELFVPWNPRGRSRELLEIVLVIWRNGTPVNGR